MIILMWRAEYTQAFEDIQTLRDIINEIRIYLGFSAIVVAFDGQEDQIQGLNNVFEILFKAPIGNELSHEVEVRPKL